MSPNFVRMWIALILVFICNGIAVAITKDNNNIALAWVIMVWGWALWTASAVACVRETVVRDVDKP